MAEPTLTARQKEVVALVNGGKTAKEIAAKLKISENGVYQQLRRLRKIGALPKTASSGRKSARKGGRAAKKRTQPRLTTTTPSPSGNGNAAVASAIGKLDPVTVVRTRLTEVKSEIADHNRAADEAVKAASALGDEQKRLEKGLTALTGRPLTVRRNNGGARKAARKSTSRRRAAASASA